MATNPSALSPDDMLVLPRPDGVEGFELVDGRPVPVSPGSPIHGRLIVEVARLLANHVIDRDLPGVVYSDAGFVLDIARDRQRTRAPDVAYVDRAKVEAHPDPERLFRCVPELAVEIDLSSARKPGGYQRIVDYLEAGVRLVWAIDPQSRTATAYRPDGSARLLRTNEALDGEDVVPDLRLELAKLFPAD